MKITIGIADDQQLFLKSLVSLINTFTDFEVILEADHGQDLLNKLKNREPKPDLLIIDVNMPVLNGPDTVKRISVEYPAIKTVALSMKNDDLSILSMLKAGSSAYLLKDIHPVELEHALKEIYNYGYYNADAINLNYRKLILKAHESREPEVTAREREFLQLAGSDLPYKAIASKMFLSEKTIDGYRDALFQKFNVRSRVGMVLEAVKRNIIDLNKET